MKLKLQNTWAITLATAVLFGCGGGGSGGTNAATGVPPSQPPVAPPITNDPGLQLTPATLLLAAYAGESLDVDINAHATRAFPGTVNVRITDDGKLLGAPRSISVRAWSPFDYTASFKTAALPAGIYDGKLDIALCQDDALICAKPHTGSPWKLPYRLEMKTFASVAGQTALSAAAGLGDWGMFQGGITHAGYVPLTVDSNRIKPRLSWFVPEGQFDLEEHSSVVVADGVAYLSDPRAKAVFALKEDDGSVLWKYESTDGLDLGYPAVYQGKVFVPTGGNSGQIVVIDAKSGTLIKKISGEDLNLSIAPTVDANAIYIRTAGGNLRAYDYMTGATLFHVSNGSSEAWFSPFTPALDSNFAYYYNRGTAFQIDRNSGAIIKSIRTTRTEFNDSQASNIGSVLLHSGTQVLFNELLISGEGNGTGTLFNMDFKTGKITWSAIGKFRGNPVIVGGTVYAVNGDEIVAMDLNSGTKLWSWAIPPLGTETEQQRDGAQGAYNLIVTNNVLFAGLTKGAYAIDLNSHKTVWSFDRGGSLSLSRNGVLYLSKGTGLFAFNLK